MLKTFCKVFLKEHREEMAAVWQQAARDWYIEGRKARADCCQALADYWRLPFWFRLRYVWKAIKIQNALKESAHVAQEDH